MNQETMSVEDVLKNLDQLINEKNNLLTILSNSVNEYVTYKNQYVVKSNELRLNPEKIQEELGLSKAATEKQQQAYIDTQLKRQVQELIIADEYIKVLKRDIELIDDKISLEKYRLKFILSLINNGGVEFGE